MKKNFLLALFLILGSGLSLKAQVGINTEDPKAYLDVDGTAGGILAPRLTSQQKTDLVEPPTGLMIFSVDDNTMQQNTGTPAIPKWSNFGGGSGDASWFYMPVTPIDVSLPDETYSVNLYNAYKKQFSNATLPTGVAASVVPAVYTVDQLDYIVLGYDKSVFSEVAITDKGVLTYKASPTNVTDSTYFNVIFKIK